MQSLKLISVEERREQKKGTSFLKNNANGKKAALWKTFTWITTKLRGSYSCNGPILQWRLSVVLCYLVHRTHTQLVIEDMLTVKTCSNPMCHVYIYEKKKKRNTPCLLFYFTVLKTSCAHTYTRIFFIPEAVFMETPLLSVHLSLCCCAALIACIWSSWGCLWMDNFRLPLTTQLHIECKYNKIAVHTI